MLYLTYQLVILLLVIIIISFAVVYNNCFKTHAIFVIFDNRQAINLINTTRSSPYIHPMFKDPEANVCYSLRSLVMPEEIINLNAIAATRDPINPSDAPANVTFNHIHTILYGDQSSTLIYRNARKYFNKAVDGSYPDTHITPDIFTSIMKQIDPSLKLQFVVEVGSFTGNSAIIMGNLLQHSHPGSFLLCIDTWLGDLNMWVNKVVWNHLSVAEDGRPTVYYQFLFNIMEQKLTDTVLPVSMSSIIGARFLQTFQFRPQLIYLDSAHEQGETLIELALYWNVLRPGGILFGDGWGWISVRCDVKKFMYIRNLTIKHIENIWLLKKPLHS